MAMNGVKMENRKYLIDTVIEKEKGRILELRRSYEERLAEFPRGSLVIRNSNGRQYCYFRYRDGKKVVTKYAGTIKKLDELKTMIAKRDELINEIKSLDDEIERIEKIEAIKK